MIRGFIAAILLAILLIFVYQNLQPVNINFLIWSFEGSLSLLLILTFMIAILVSILVAVPYKLKKSLDKRNASKSKNSEEKPI